MLLTMSWMRKNSEKCLIESSVSRDSLLHGAPLTSSKDAPQFLTLLTRTMLSKLSDLCRNFQWDREQWLRPFRAEVLSKKLKKRESQWTTLLKIAKMISSSPKKSSLMRETLPIFYQWTRFSLLRKAKKCCKLSPSWTTSTRSRWTWGGGETFCLSHLSKLLSILSKFIFRKSST